jgi:hypothetical protein
MLATTRCLCFLMSIRRGPSSGLSTLFRPSSYKKQGCQMVYFLTQNPHRVNFCGSRNVRFWYNLWHIGIFCGIWYILCHFCIFCGHLVNFPHFGICIVPRKICRRVMRKLIKNASPLVCSLYPKLHNGLCFDKIISLYFRATKTTTIDIGAKRKRHFLYLLKNLQKNY